MFAKHKKITKEFVAGQKTTASVDWNTQRNLDRLELGLLFYGIINQR